MSPSLKSQVVESFKSVLGVIFPVLTELTGISPQGFAVMELSDPTFVDVKNGVLTLFDRFETAMKTKNFIEAAWCIYQLYNPFHVSGEVFFESKWHIDFICRFEEDIRRLPFLYKKEIAVGNDVNLSKRDLINYLNRVVAGRTENFVEAYKYGNGYNVIKHHILPEYFDSLCNSILGVLLKIKTGVAGEPTTPVLDTTAR